MSDKKILFNIADGLGLIRLNRPEAANAYTQLMLHDLEVVLKDFAADPKVALVAITGSDDKYFCAGADLKEMAQRKPEEAADLLSARLFDDIAVYPKPVIAAINGPAIGGGLELALACDLRISTPGATFALPEVSLGILPAAGGIRRLPPLIGAGRAKEMILFARKIDAQTALDWGLVNELVKPGKLTERLADYAQVVGSLKPETLKAAKEGIGISDANKSRQYVAQAQARLYQLKRNQDR